MAAVLLQMLDRRRLPATWAMADPASCSFARRLAASRQGHEVALCADRTWAGPGVRRPRLAAELGHRLTRARVAGCVVDSLALSGVRLEQNLDVLVKYGISSLICGSANSVGQTQRTRNSPGRASSLRFGLWEIAATAELPSRADWLWRGAGVHPQSAGPAVFLPGLPVNLVKVDVSALAAKGARGLRLMDRVFRLAEEHRDAGRQEVLTSSELTRRLTKPRQLLPARSILRAA
jgi:hypothetical protein